MEFVFLHIVPGLLAVGVLLAAVVLVTLSRQWAVRTLLFGAGVYGAWAPGRAAVIGVPLGQVLGNWPPAISQALDSAVVGVFLILPLGWIVAVLRAGIPRIRRRSPHVIVYQAISLTLCVSIVAASFPRSAPVPTLAANGSALTQADRLKLFDDSMRAIEDADRDMPRDRWDPDYVVQAIGKDPQKLIEWVRDNTSWIPYHGVLRGAAGVLMDRKGNSLDRALLLESLLASSGVKARLARRTTTAAEATSLVAALFHTAPSGQAAGETDGETSVAVNPATYGLDREQGATEEITRRLQTNTKDQSTVLLASLGPTKSRGSWEDRIDAAVEAARDHWWVQWFDGGTWRDANVVALDTPPADVVASETFTANDLPRDLQHTVTITVTAEYVDDGRIATRQVLAHAFAAAQVGAEPIVLQFWPGAWPSQVASDPDSKFGVKAAAMEQDEWGAILQVNQKALETGVVTRRNVAPPEADNPFAGMASAFSRSTSADRLRSELSALWIDYETAVPGIPAHRDRRYVFDLLGADRRAKKAALPPLTGQALMLRSLSLMMRTEILLVNASLAPEFVTHRAAAAMEGNRALLRAVINDRSGENDESLHEALRHSEPPLSPLLVLAASRMAWSPVRNHIAIDRPDVLSRHAWPAVVDNQIVVRDAFDIVVNDIAVSLSHPNPFAIRVKQGVFETGLEAAVTSARPDSNVALAFTGADHWRMLTAGDSPADQLSLPADVQQGIETDLSAGYTIVAPSAPVHIGASTFSGYWRIDGRTGSTLGINDAGWGGSLLERARLNALATTMIEGWAFEYGLCMGVPQIVNAAVIFNEALLLTVFGRRYVQPKDPGRLARGNNKMCLIQGIITGAFATLPLLLMTVRAGGRGAGVLGRLARASEVPPVSRRPPPLQAEPVVTGRGVDPVGNTELQTKVSPQSPRGAPTDLDPRSPPEIKASRGSNDPAMFEARYAQGQAKYAAADAAGDKAWNEYWESSRQAANRGEPRPPLPQELKDLARKSAEALEDLEDLEAQKERIQRDQKIADKNANKAGVRDGDTQRSGQSPPTPAPAPAPNAPAPCPANCDETLPELKTITGIGAAAQAFRTGGD